MSGLGSLLNKRISSCINSGSGLGLSCKIQTEPNPRPDGIPKFCSSFIYCDFVFVFVFYKRLLTLIEKIKGNLSLALDRQRSED